MVHIADRLLQNSKASQLACIEIHNKPIFPFRYEVCVILNINSWELLFKSFIIKFHPAIKIINNDGTTKPFEECLNFIASQLGIEFILIKQNLEKIYEYRCNAIHFYQDNIEVLLCSLLSKNILLYHEFLLKHFEINIADEINLILLPIGFKKPASPIDFLSNESSIKCSSEAVQMFVKSIIRSTDVIANAGVDDSILFYFKMGLINENRIKNADIIAAISKDKNDAKIVVNNIIGDIVLTNDGKREGVKTVKIEEESLYQKIYPHTYSDVVQHCKLIFSDFVKNKKFTSIMNRIKENPTYHKKRYLDITKNTGTGKDFYTEKIFDELAKSYTKQI